MGGVPTRIQASVRDERGHAISDARVWFTRGPEALPDVAALTDVNGECVLAAPTHGQYVVRCAADGFTPTEHTTNVGAEGKAEITVVLKRHAD
jgi:hypothetical protein